MSRVLRPYTIDGVTKTAKEWQKSHGYDATATWRRAKLSAGLCAKCNDKAVPGKTLCEKHQAKNRSDRKSAHRMGNVNRHHLSPPDIIATLRSKEAELDTQLQSVRRELSAWEAYQAVMNNGEVKP